jgi:hypothetical protein
MIFIFKIGFIKENKKGERAINRKINDLMHDFGGRMQEMKAEVGSKNYTAQVTAQAFFNQFEKRISALENRKQNKEKNERT